MKIERSIGEQRKLDRLGRCERARIGYVVSGVGKDQTGQAVAAVFAAAPGDVDGIPKNSVDTAPPRINSPPVSSVGKSPVPWMPTDAATAYWYCSAPSARVMWTHHTGAQTSG